MYLKLNLVSASVPEIRALMLTDKLTRELISVFAALAISLLDSVFFFKLAT